MNDALKMQISAFVDGELPAEEAELLTRRLSRDAELREQASQYLAIGRLLRGEREFAGADGLRARINEAVAGEEFEPAAADGGKAPRYLRPLAGVAVAASVAVLALVGLQRYDLPTDAGTTMPAIADVVAIDDISYTEPGTAAAEPGELLRQYYLSHGATSGDLGANGILSRLVTLELREGDIPASEEAGDATTDTPDDNNNDTETVQDQ